MKIVRYTTGKKAAYGILKGKQIHCYTGTPYARFEATDDYLKLSDVKLLAPCVPTTIIALGLNYRGHAEESKMPIPEEPLIFFKPVTSIIGPEEKIVYPRSSKRVDYEGELAVVMKKRARHISKEEALSYVLGYTCLNDVSARDIQFREKSWTSRAKGFDTFCPVGPWIETKLDPDNVMLETYLNGEVRQRCNTNDMVFTTAEQISFISEIMTLLPGDIIATGTPGGIAPMNPGDTVEIKIEKIGMLRNYVVADTRA
jgi:2-keto-4-pentenoate hydratase/2-oxohepta-3-ene-1,7-dioic acid hydratase in catechol pathway